MINTVAKGQKAVANWMMIGVGMLIVQVILGGITRLTGSGLSITEWNVVTGTLPPLNEQQWMAEFDKYKQTPQFNLLNADFTLPHFKFIFFLGMVSPFLGQIDRHCFHCGFCIPAGKKIPCKPPWVKPLLVLFLLGAMQGTIGWIMVKSGLTDDMVYVKPVKLAPAFCFCTPAHLLCLVVCPAALGTSAHKYRRTKNSTIIPGSYWAYYFFN